MRVLFDDRQQLAEVVDVAERVPGVGVVAVGLEPVVDGDAPEVREHAGVIEPVEAAFVVQRVERQPVGAGGEQPAQATLDASAGLVEVRDRRGDELAVHLVQEPLEILAARGDVAGQRPGRDRRAEPVSEQLGRAR